MSLTETAYKFIFEGILNGRFRAGQSISPDSIAESLKISKTPIREALVQLEVEGLIFRNGRYYNVIFLDEREVLELFSFRNGVRGLFYYTWAYRNAPQVPAFEIIGSEAAIKYAFKYEFVSSFCQTHPFIRFSFNFRTPHDL